MATSNPGEELLSNIASLSPPLSLKSGTLDLPNVNDSLPLDINPTPEPTSKVIPSTTQSTTRPLLKLATLLLHLQKIFSLRLIITLFPLKRNIVSSKILYLLILVIYLPLSIH